MDGENMHTLHRIAINWTCNFILEVTAQTTAPLCLYNKTPKNELVQEIFLIPINR